MTTLKQGSFCRLFPNGIAAADRSGYPVSVSRQGDLTNGSYEECCVVLVEEEAEFSGIVDDSRN